MKKFSKIVALGAVLAAASPLALADSINGSFNLSGSDTYTTNTLQFVGGAVGATGMSGTTGITGTFATYLTDGNAISFFPGVLAYTTGGTQTVTPPLQLFSTTEGGETFAFTLSGYNAMYSSDPIFGTDLVIQGTGIFSGSGGTAYTSSPGVFNFSSQIAPNGSANTTFSASTQALGTTAVTPEPNSLVLLGTGLMGAAGMLFMRRRHAADVL